MKYRKADNGIQHFVEEMNHLKEWKITKVFYTEQDALDYIKDNK
jgi:hypothetical protein